MRNVPQPFLLALQTAVSAVLERDELNTFSILQLGVNTGFLTNVKEGAYPDQLVSFLTFLRRKGRLLEFAKSFLHVQQGNSRSEVEALRQQFNTLFTVDPGSGKIGLSKEQFRLVRVGPGMPFVGRDKFRDHLRRVLGGEDNVHNVLSLSGGARSGQSFLGAYLAEVGRRLEIFTIISVDFKRDLPVGPGEQITAVHLADTISRRLPGLEEYQNMYRDRPDDFKLSSFTQSLIRQLQASEKLFLFFFDHLNYVPLTDSVLDMIVYVTDKIAQPDTPGLVVTSGLSLRPQDRIFGDLHPVMLGSFTRRQVAIYFNYLYDSISTPDARADLDAKREFLRNTMKAFPEAFFEDPALATVAEIGERCKMVTRIVLEQSQPAEEEVDDGLILDF